MSNSLHPYGLPLPKPIDWVTIPQAAKLMGISRSSAYKLISRGRYAASGDWIKLYAWKTPRGIVTSLDLIDEFLQEMSGSAPTR